MGTISAFSVNIQLSHIMYVFFCVLFTFYLLWFLREKLEISKNGVFDILLLSLAGGLLFSRIVYIVLHLSEYVEGVWRVYPYFLDENNNRVLFYDKPWIFLRIWDGGLSFFGVVLGVFLGIMLYKNISRKERSKPFLLFIILFWSLGAARAINLVSTLYFQHEIEPFFRESSMISIYIELALVLILGAFVVFFNDKLKKIGWWSVIIIFWIGMAISGQYYNSSLSFFMLNGFQIIAVLVLAVYLAHFILHIRVAAGNMFIAKGKVKTKERERGDEVLPPTEGHRTQHVKTYSLSFRDMDAIGPLYNIRRRFYALKRRLSRLFKK